jgi:hypothetical protein
MIEAIMHAMASNYVVRRKTIAAGANAQEAFLQFEKEKV